MAYEPPFKRTGRIESLCIEIAELVGRVSPQADLAKSPTLHRQLRIQTIHSSLVIEGNQLDESAVTAVLDGKRVLGSANDIREVENAQRAYNLLPTLNPYSIEDLLTAHRAMMEGLAPDAGRFRSGNVGVFDGNRLIHAGTPAAYVPEVTAELFEWLEKTDVHPLVASCAFHFEFEFIHPFSDGNGRTGRLWHTLLLSQWRPLLQWLPVESTIRKRQTDYYAALAESDAAGSCERFMEFMLEAIRDSLAPFAGVQNARETTLANALSFLGESPTASVPQLAEHLACSQRSAERIVAELKKTGRLAREGTPRAGRWVVLG